MTNNESDQTERVLIAEAGEENSSVDKVSNALEKRIHVASAVAWSLIGLGFLAAGYGVAGFFNGYAFSSVPKEHLAGLGNFLQGSVASLWSLAAFIFVYVAFLGQRLQLDAQKEDIRQNQKRSEQETAVAMRQRFENTFFELLRLHHGLVNAMRIKGRDLQMHEGRSSFHVIYQELQHAFKNIGEKNPTMAPGEKLELAYTEFYRIYQPEIGHYFQNFYEIARFVDEGDLTRARRHDGLTHWEDSILEHSLRQPYANILRAQISSEEALLLFYHAGSNWGKAGLRALTSRYSLLQNLPWRRLLDEGHTHGELGVLTEGCF